MTVRHQELRSKALALGKRFYAEEPDAFCDRLGAYWEAWWKEPDGDCGDLK